MKRGNYLPVDVPGGVVADVARFLELASLLNGHANRTEKRACCGNDGKDHADFDAVYQSILVNLGKGDQDGDDGPHHCLDDEEGGADCPAGKGYFSRHSQLMGSKPRMPAKLVMVVWGALQSSCASRMGKERGHGVARTVTLHQGNVEFAELGELEGLENLELLCGREVRLEAAQAGRGMGDGGWGVAVSESLSGRGHRFQGWVREG